MAKPKFRLFAGPNASGKTHVFKKFRKKKYLHTAIYVNADRYEEQLKVSRRFSFNAYRVKVDEDEFRKFILNSGLYKSKFKGGDKTFVDKLSIREGILHIDEVTEINSYHGSFIASYLAEKLFETGQDFGFETVMSHKSKVALLKLAASKGYKTYFYFIFTDNLDTNRARAVLRVKQHGHFVPDETIVSRAPKVFALMPNAFRLADSSYIIDNSVDAKLLLKKENNKITEYPPYPKNIESGIKKILKTSNR